MTFKAYIDNITAKTGKTPADFLRMAEKKGFVEKGTIKTGVKAGQIVDWLKADFELGHGHAMAIVAVLKGRSEDHEAPAKKTSSPRRARS